MLLSDYCRSIGLQGFGRGTDSPPGSLRIIHRFTFGNYFLCRTHSGMNVAFSDLNSICECIRDEFRLADTFDAEVTFQRGGMGSIVMEPKAVMGRPWGRDIDRLVSNLQLWVTEFSLTDVWGQDVLRLPRNLAILRDY